MYDSFRMLNMNAASKHLGDRGGGAWSVAVKLSKHGARCLDGDSPHHRDRRGGRDVKAFRGQLVRALLWVASGYRIFSKCLGQCFFLPLFSGLVCWILVEDGIPQEAGGMTERGNMSSGRPCQWKFRQERRSM